MQLAGNLIKSRKIQSGSRNFECDKLYNINYMFMYA